MWDVPLLPPQKSSDVSPVSVLGSHFSCDAVYSLPDQSYHSHAFNSVMYTDDYPVNIYSTVLLPKLKPYISPLRFPSDT